ncbi:SCAN domain-containing 3-like protein [Labeo rohita]|uniref:SCAN domain-containing 3-like protein n=1 Tax=Labeo rohita TaxID=84645 RepID=A0A498LW02_LABRO|nr:SCAN domain-containing 3-like protein [Labeo rohita]
MERKRKGGAERERIKRKKALAADAASCCKIPAMFASKGTGSDSAFVKGGMQAWKHAHQRVQEHERSSIHRESAEAFFLRVNKADIHTLLTDKQMTIHRDQEHVSDCIEKKKKQTIAVEVRKAGMFSIQIDTTQDLTSKDQCAVVLRYVTDVVHEKLIAVIDCESSTGQYFVELVKQTLEKMDIDIKKCIGNATDEAANMQGQYKADTTGVVVASESLFSLLNDIAVFIRDSYKRLKLWEENSEDKRHRRLGVIGETRWWAKDEALRKVFGRFAKPDNALYTDLVITMEKI